MVPTLAVAQPIPGPGDIQRIPDRFDERFAPLVTPEAPPLVVEPTDEPAQDLDALRFTFTSLQLEGNTALPTEDLQELWADKIGTEISVLDLYRIANAITAAYRDAGYILSRAIVPAQRIGDDGAARIRIVEGFVSKVIVEGEDESGNALIADMLRQIEGMAPLNIFDLERLLLLADDLAGVEVETVLKPSVDTPGAAELVVTIARDPFEAYLSSDNRGSRLLGPVQTEAGVFANNLFGLNGRLAARGIVSSPTRELRYGEVTYLQPIGTAGTAITARYLKAETEPSEALRVLEIQGDTEEGELLLTHPLIRGRAENLRVRAAFTTRSSDTIAIGNTELANDDLRIVSLGATYDWQDAWRGIGLVSVDVSQGLDILGASETTDLNLSRAEGKADFLKVEGEASRLQSLTQGLALYALAGFQYTNDALLSSEEFGAGGDRFGRGYDPSEITGDKGLALSLELQFTPSDFEVPNLDQVQLYTFYDAAAVWDNDSTATGRRSLASAGLGVRVQAFEKVSGFVELAKPLTRTIATRANDEPRVLAGVTVRF